MTSDKTLAGKNSQSAQLYKELINELLIKDGLIQYRDSYCFAKLSIDENPEAYSALFAARFKYVFIDEYQDCNNIQRQTIESIFDSKKCVVMRIGDIDQAIYNSYNADSLDWKPVDDYLSIKTSFRYNQEIADVISRLKQDGINITANKGNTNGKPVLLVFPPEKIGKVIDEFIKTLDKYGLIDNNGVYKAIGFIRKDDGAGLKIGSYWSDFDGSVVKQSEYNYWNLLDRIVEELSAGKLYKVEPIVRKLLCRIFHYLKSRNNLIKEYSVTGMKSLLDAEYRDGYRQWIYELSKIQNPDVNSIDCLVRRKINELLKAKYNYADNPFSHLPRYFLENKYTEEHEVKSEGNIFIDPIYGRKIEFTTIHCVKGETHDATLYLETSNQNSTDLKRILPYFGVGKPGHSKLFDYSRKLAYVGMSRAKFLLCVAMQIETYEHSGGVFDEGWDIIDLRD